MTRVARAGLFRTRDICACPASAAACHLHVGPMGMSGLAAFALISCVNWRALLPSRLVGQAHACTRGLARVVSRRGWSANHLPTFASVGTIVRCEWARAVSDARVLSSCLPAPLCTLADVGGQAHVSRYINDESIGPHY